VLWSNNKVQLPQSRIATLSQYIHFPTRTERDNTDSRGRLRYRYVACVGRLDQQLPFVDMKSAA
jgi:hypothetical protein